MKLLAKAAVLGFVIGAMLMAGTKAADWAIPDKPRAPLKLKVTPDETSGTTPTDDAAERRAEI